MITALIIIVSLNVIVQIVGHIALERNSRPFKKLKTVDDVINFLKTKQLK